jgi:DNA-binding GntR family transcriptional regulator
VSDTLTQRAYIHIHEKLTRGKLAAGSRLSNRAVAKEMGISLTPVRGAFNRLISEGLLEYQPGLGVFVPMTHRREIEELYEFREMLECASVTKICGQVSDRALKEMEEYNEELAAMLDRLEKTSRSFKDSEQMEQLRVTDTKFHVALLRAAGNRRIVETVEGLRIRTQIVCHRFHDEAFDNLPRTVGEHRQILEALRRGDAETAKNVLSEHIRRGCQLALECHEQGYMDQPRHLGGGPH